MVCRKIASALRLGDQRSVEENRSTECIENASICRLVDGHQLSVDISIVECGFDEFQCTNLYPSGSFFFEVEGKMGTKQYNS